MGLILAGRGSGKCWVPTVSSSSGQHHQRLCDGDTYCRDSWAQGRIQANQRYWACWKDPRRNREGKWCCLTGMGENTGKLTLSIEPRLVFLPQGMLRLYGILSRVMVGSAIGEIFKRFVQDGLGE